MHVSVLASLATIVGLAVSNPVTIVNWSGNNCSGSSRQCTNIARHTCCKSSTRDYSSSRFIGLYETELGIVFKPKGSTKCGTSVRSNNGERICINGGFLALRGSQWVSCLDCMFEEPGTTPVNDQRDVKVDPMEALMQKYNEGADGDCINTVEPDKMTLSDGHMFNIGPDVPEADAQALNDFLDADASIADIPAHLLAYEVESEGVTERLVEAKGI